MWLGGTANGNYGPILNLTLSSANSNYCIDNAVVMQTYPDSVINLGKLGGNLKVYKKRNNDGIVEQTYAYVKFDISGLNNQQAESAKLSFRGKTGDANFNDLFKLGLYAVTQDWKGDTVKWKTKPSINASKMDTSLLNSSSARKEFNTNGTKLIDFINEEVRKGSKSIGLAIMSFGKDSTDNMWIGGLANGNYGPVLDLKYQTVYGSIPPAQVVLNPNGGNFIINVNVKLVNKPAKDSVFYTIGKGTVEDPTRNSTLFPEAGLTFTDTTTLKVIASRDGVYGNMVTATYNVLPVASPVFNPSPMVKYQKKVEVTISTTPADAVIYYSKDGSDPSEPYTQAIQLTQTTTLKTKAFSADFAYETPVVEATYQIVNTEDLPGTGPAGVGYKNLTRDNQPEVGLWLKPEAFTGLTDGSEVKLWNDMSGNS
ncbi:MAG: DNRLRE domain-containing protein, partial [Bacteroidales bacterium]|nr:DNRLRE domain-containing protein [Bacteroidales bacterium]